ncbi:MAG: bifunctional diguanylate cyclase/phosphodiesterase [Pseudomonadota bacterium]
MALKELKSSPLGRVSLAWALPLVSLALAMAMAVLFLLVSFIAVEYRAYEDSKHEAERIAEMVSQDLSRAHMDGVSSIIHAYVPADVTVLTTDGTLVASSNGVRTSSAVHSVPIAYDGDVIGQLQTGRLVDSGLSIPGWGIVLLVVMAGGLAFTSGHFFAVRVVRSVQQISAVAHGLRAGDAKAEDLPLGADFSELREMYVSMRRAVARVRREADDLKKEAFTNPVSGLPNFSALMRSLSFVLEQADFDHPAALFCLDLDHFDRACESFGGAVGDVLLIKTIARIQAELDTLGEQGRVNTTGTVLAQPWADSLYLLLPNIGGRAQASEIARALRSAFVPPVEACGYEVKLGLSGGIVMIPEDGQTTNDLVRRGETALRNVRNETRQGFRFYAPRMDRMAKGRAQLESDIREAIEIGEFVPFFQPKLDLRTGRIKGCEALARWQRPGGRSVPPSAFIPVAEETGLIDDIGHIILRGACDAAVGWLQDGLAVSVAVNVSPVQIRNPNFRDLVLDALANSGLPPRFLELEITESIAIEDPVAFQNTVDPLRAMGVRLALDDFGTGHSNLAILSRLNFDVFKIDRQFIQNLDRDDSARPIIEMILAMAESLGLETVAEGVETIAHARFLRQRGCTYGQGFLYSPALPRDDFLAYAQNWEARRQQSVIAKAS